MKLKPEADGAGAGADAAPKSALNALLGAAGAGAGAGVEPKA